jgi:hypothetical protein
MMNACPRDAILVIAAASPFAFSANSPNATFLFYPSFSNTL